MFKTKTNIISNYPIKKNKNKNCSVSLPLTEADSKAGARWKFTPKK